MKKILFSSFLLLFFFFPRLAFAEVIHSFDVKVVANKQGLLNVQEIIDYDFEDIDHHGIYRNIPLFAKVGDLYRISKFENFKIFRDGSPEQYDLSSDKNQLTLKIGNPNRTMTGDHKYEIDYSVENAIGSNFSDHDEIYWNGTGNNWDVTIEKATEQITTDFNLSPTKIICFEGPYGSKDQTCKIDGNTVSSGQTYYPGYGLSVVAVYPVGTFPKTILSTTPPETFGDKVWNFITKNYKYIWIFLNVIIPLLLSYWYQMHKNKKNFGPPAVNFDIPKDESGERIAPALAGTIDNAKLERDDVTATIFDLAIRKYIKLEQEKQVKSLMPDKVEQKIIKLKEGDSSLEPYEQTLMDRLFEGGDVVKVSELKLDFYKTYQDMEDQVFAELVAKKYYSKNPKYQRGFLVFLGTISLFTLNIILGIVFFYLARKMNGRTALGDEIDFKIDGLKLFLKSMDRNYKWQAKNFYTVEQMIPYAMALGYIEQFMEALKILKPNYNPSWYSGYNGNFFLTYALFSSATSSNLTTSAPSSSSGAGGGGFSGGGGGGGGGGGW